MNIGIQINKDLIGNLIILLAHNCKSLHHTKMMKLLYLIDEEATKRTGTPITWLDYKAWQLGPVSQELFYSKNEGYNKFSDYIRFEKEGKNNRTKVIPIKDFDDSEFSELDLEIVNFVLDLYKDYTTEKLIDITHAKGSLWSNVVKRNEIHFSQENKTSDESLNFLELIEDDDYKKSVYYSTLENLEIQSSL